MVWLPTSREIWTSCLSRKWPKERPLSSRRKRTIQRQETKRKLKRVRNVYKTTQAIQTLTTSLESLRTVLMRKSDSARKRRRRRKMPCPCSRWRKRCSKTKTDSNQKRKRSLRTSSIKRNELDRTMAQGRLTTKSWPRSSSIVSTNRVKTLTAVLTLKSSRRKSGTNLRMMSSATHSLRSLKKLQWRPISTQASYKRWLQIGQTTKEWTWIQKLVLFRIGLRLWWISRRIWWPSSSRWRSCMHRLTKRRSSRPEKMLAMAVTVVSQTIAMYQDSQACLDSPVLGASIAASGMFRTTWHSWKVRWALL